MEEPQADPDGGWETPVDRQQVYDRLAFSPVDRLKESCHPPTSVSSGDAANAWEYGGL